MQNMRTLALAAAFGAFALMPLHADEWNKKTIVTINAPVQLPSITLQPGTYTLKLLDSASDRHVVTVWDKDGMHLITTILAIPNYRLRPTGKSTFTFWETPADETQAVRAWFYPGDNVGQEFQYPKAKAQQIGIAAHMDVPTLSDQDETKLATRSDNQEAQVPLHENSTPQEPAPQPTAVASNATPEPAPAPVAAAPEPAPAPAPVAAPEPAPEAQEPAAAATPAMPATASNRNELMSLGMLLGLTGLSTFLVRTKKRS